MGVLWMIMRVAKGQNRWHGQFNGKRCVLMAGKDLTTKLSIEIGKKKIELDIDQWREVYVQLQELFDKKETVYIPYQQPFVPPYITYDTIRMQPLEIDVRGRS